jgi:hypothetical protein
MASLLSFEYFLKCPANRESLSDGVGDKNLCFTILYVFKCSDYFLRLPYRALNYTLGFNLLGFDLGFSFA